MRMETRSPRWSSAIQTIALHQEIFNHAAFRSGGQDIHYLERRLGRRMKSCAARSLRSAMPFLQLSFELAASASEAVEQACFANGALSVTLLDDG